MINEYMEEVSFIKDVLKESFDKIYYSFKKERIKKSDFDIVTPVDTNMEDYIINKIIEKYPYDRILSEETLSNTELLNRTWTIDPIDGTFNMANDSMLFGVQVSLFLNDEVVMSVIYLPLLKEMYYAVKDNGAYLNDEKLDSDICSFENTGISFGDFPHSRLDEAKMQLKMIDYLKDKIAKIRMFGAASIDFAFAASNKTAGCVLFTKNKWDIAPGILLCKEAGCIVASMNGDYSWDSNVVIVTKDLKTLELIRESVNSK